MEINYFLDKKQSEFDELTADMFHDADIDTIDTVEENDLNTLLKWALTQIRKQWIMTDWNKSFHNIY